LPEFRKLKTMKTLLLLLLLLLYTSTAAATQNRKKIPLLPSSPLSCLHFYGSTFSYQSASAVLLLHIPLLPSSDLQFKLGLRLISGKLTSPFFFSPQVSKHCFYSLIFRFSVEGLKPYFTDDLILFGPCNLYISFFLY
jgi:hypothetical protein